MESSVNVNSQIRGKTESKGNNIIKANFAKIMKKIKGFTPHFKVILEGYMNKICNKDVNLRLLAVLILL